MSSPNGFIVHVPGSHIIGCGPTPQLAVRRFWRRAWEVALDAVTDDQEWDWGDREAIALVRQRWPLNWHRALVARGVR